MSTAWIAAWVAENTRRAWIAVIVLALGIGYLFGQQGADEAIEAHQSHLALEAEQLRIELLGQTVNGRSAGVAGLLGLLDERIKQDAQAIGAVNAPAIAGYLESIGGMLEASGVFVVPGNGIVRSAWDIGGKPSTGVDVRARTYFQAAMLGRTNVYAAVGMNTGKRALYTAAPVFLGQTRQSPIMGAIVARTGIEAIERLLAREQRTVLLLTPQNMIFASHPPQWFGHLAGRSGPEVLQEIRERKQFGNLFENKTPVDFPLPATPGLTGQDGRTYAVARVPVAWNDPQGDWSLVLISDLAQSVPSEATVRPQVVATLLALLLGLLALHGLRSQHARALARAELAALAAENAEHARRKTLLTEAAVRLQQQRNLPGLGRTFLGEAHRLLDVLQGAVYLPDAAGCELQLLAAYAADPGLPPVVPAGQGLLGQCLRDRQPRQLSVPPERYWRIRSSLGSTPPGRLLLTPVCLNDRLLAVVELAFVGDIAAPLQALAGELTDLLAINLQMLDRQHGAEHPENDA